MTSLPFAGHVGAMAAVSCELVQRGHDVVVHTGAKYSHRFEGAEWLPWKHAPDFDDARLAEAFPSIGDGKGMRSNFANVRRARDPGDAGTGADDLLRPAIEAIAGQDMLVVATTGGAPAETLGPLPPNVRAASFIPHDLLLLRTDLMITNGGWGGVLAALEAGVPLVAVPGELDKTQVARRVAPAGAGVMRRKPKRLRQAVDHVLSQPRHRERARELGARIRAAGGAARAADGVEELLRRR